MSETETEPTAFEEVQAATGPIELMRDMAEQSDSSDLSFVPEAYRRDTVEETARVLLESQKHAQRKITELAMRNSELEAALTAQAETQSYEQPVYDQYAYEQPAYAPPQFDARQVAAMASQVVQEKLLTPHAAELAYQAEQLVASQVPEYAANRDKVFEAVQRDPSLLASAVATGDAREIAGALANVHQSLATSGVSPDLMRTMKMQAQTVTGAGGRALGVTDGEQRWQEIRNADNGKLGL